MEPLTAANLITKLNLEVQRLTLALHKHRAHPDYEYATTQNARKSGDTPWPEGDGWEKNYCSLNADGTINFNSCWERFDFHEDNYWRRKKQP